MKLTLGLLLAAVLAALIAFLVGMGQAPMGTGVARKGSTGGSTGGSTAIERGAWGVDLRAVREGPSEPAPLPRTLAGEGPQGTPSSRAEEPRLARVRARAVTADGRAVSGAWMAARNLALPPVRGDAEGRLELSLSADELELLVERSSYRTLEFEVGAPGRATRRVPRRVEEGELEVELGQILLSSGAVLHGRVVDESGLGIEGALVAFCAPIEAEPGSEPHASQGPADLRPMGLSGLAGAIRATSEAGGAFRLSGLPAGHGSLWARTETSLWSFTRPIGLRAGEEVGEVVLVLREAPERVVAGVLVDPEGRPLPGRMVMGAQRSVSEFSQIAHTDAAGQFRFVAQDARAPYDLEASSPSWEWDHAELTGIQPGTSEVVLAFQPSEWLWITVRDPAGRPIPTGRLFGLEVEGATDRGFPRCESTLGADGRGRLRRPSEPLLVRAEAPGYRNALIGPFDPSRFPDPLVVTLERAPAIVGRVRRADGRPAAGARVRLHRGALEREGRGFLTHQHWEGAGEPFVYALELDAVAEVRCDLEGRFRLTLPGVEVRAERERGAYDPAFQARMDAALAARDAARGPRPPQNWYVHAALEGQGSVTLGPRSLGSSEDVELELALAATGAVAGRLVLEGGAEPSGWSVHAADGLAHVVQSAVASDGSFRFEALHPGGWQMRAFEPGARFHVHAALSTARIPEHDVVVVAGRTVQYEHRAAPRPRARLGGELTIDGAPPGPWTARVVARRLPSGGASFQHLVLDPDGRFELWLEPGMRADLELRRIGGHRGLVLSAELDIAPGDNEWSFELVSASLTGIVAAPQDARGRGGWLSYEAEREGVLLRAFLPVDAEGRFGPLIVPAGPGILRDPSSGSGFEGTIRARLDLSRGEEHMLDLR